MEDHARARDELQDSMIGLKQTLIHTRKDIIDLGEVPVKLVTDVWTALEVFFHHLFIHFLACAVSLWAVIKALYCLLCAVLAFCSFISIAAVLASLDRAHDVTHNTLVAIRSASSDVVTFAKTNLSLTRLACRKIVTTVKDQTFKICAATTAGLNRGGAVCYNVITNPTAIIYPRFLGYTYHQVLTRLVALVCVWIAVEYCLRAAMGVDQEEFRNVVRLAAARTPNTLVRLSSSLFGHLSAFTTIFCISAAITGTAFTLHNVGNFLLSPLAAILVVLWNLFNVKILGYSLRPLTVILLLTRFAVYISLTSSQFSLWIAIRLLDFHEYFECVIFEPDGECRAGGGLDPALMLAGVAIGLLATLIIFWKSSHIKARMAAVRQFLTSNPDRNVSKADPKAEFMANDGDDQADNNLIVEAYDEPNVILPKVTNDEEPNKDVSRNKWSDVDINKTNEPNHHVKATSIEASAHSTTEATNENSIADVKSWIAANAHNHDKASNKLNKLINNNEEFQSVEQSASHHGSDRDRPAKNLNSSAQNSLNRITGSENLPTILSANAIEQPLPYSARPATSLKPRLRPSPSTIPSDLEIAHHSISPHVATPSKESSIAAATHSTTSVHEETEYADFETQLHKSFNLSPLENLQQTVMPTQIANVVNSDTAESSQVAGAHDVEAVINAPGRDVASIAADSCPPTPHRTTPSESSSATDTTQLTTDVNSNSSVDEWAGFAEDLDKLNEPSTSSSIESKDLASTSNNMDTFRPDTMDAQSVETVTNTQAGRPGAGKSDHLSLPTSPVLEPDEFPEENFTVLDSLDRIAAPSHSTDIANNDEKKLGTKPINDPNLPTLEDVGALPLPISTSSNPTDVLVQRIQNPGIDPVSIFTPPVDMSSSTGSTKSHKLPVSSAVRAEVSAQSTPPSTEDSHKPFSGMPVDTSSSAPRRLGRETARESIAGSVNSPSTSQVELPKSVQEKEADVRVSSKLGPDRDDIEESSNIAFIDTQEAARTPPTIRPDSLQSLEYGHTTISTREKDDMDLYRYEESANKSVSTNSTILEAKTEAAPARFIKRFSPQQSLSELDVDAMHAPGASDSAIFGAETPATQIHSSSDQSAHISSTHRESNREPSQSSSTNISDPLAPLRSPAAHSHEPEGVEHEFVEDQATATSTPQTIAGTTAQSQSIATPSSAQNEQHLEGTPKKKRNQKARGKGKSDGKDKAG
ncbi:hypothetical protein N0V94_002145 [Neodidymelliopsis sp. IMI 364377]|nr:hypothetical protein N0V94_002145 [Neodidymelliopsis sp. IMI 364377]